jgi:23S rRNA (uracil1939-C5)-methyltransferase
LFIKDELDIDWNELDDKGLQGFEIVYSDPRSPASVQTKILFSKGEMTVYESFDQLDLMYPFHGFFQVNPPVFNQSLNDMRGVVQEFDNAQDLTLVDLYSGVGTIGLGLADQVKKVIGVEEFPGSKAAAEKNAEKNEIQNFEGVEARSEDVLDWIEQADILVVDPPRIGLHDKVVEKILEMKPKHLIYLSCNPKTQAENMARLFETYDIVSSKSYNYYPRTPHVENLVVAVAR